MVVGVVLVIMAMLMGIHRSDLVLEKERDIGKLKEELKDEKINTAKFSNLYVATNTELEKTTKELEPAKSGIQTLEELNDQLSFYNEDLERQLREAKAQASAQPKFRKITGPEKYPVAHTEEVLKSAQDRLAANNAITVTGVSAETRVGTVSVKTNQNEDDDNSG